MYPRVIMARSGTEPIAAWESEIHLKTHRTERRRYVAKYAISLTTFAIAWLGVNDGSKSWADDRFFEARIRPLFISHCLPCHSDLQADGGLSLESREGWADRQVITPGDPDASLLLKVLRGEVADLQMPPSDSEQQRLSSEQVNDLKKWIRDGAVDPRSRNTSSLGPKRRAKQFQITEQDLRHWAYQPLSTMDPAMPHDLNSSAVVDRILTQDHSAHGIAPTAAATPRELVRRAYFDLWGLPPDPAVVEQFCADPSEKAWAELVERLLASRHYGERWGRYWLDWVRFAESNGYERDGPKPHAWRYRDYVIDSFQNDKPYDRFLTEQLAGDLLLDDPALTNAQNPAARRDAIIATGYYRLHIWDDEPDDSQAAEFDDLDDVMVTTGAAIMGLTIGCARCHDHKFDPVSQADYYSMLDLFRDIDPYGMTIHGGGSRGTGRIESWLCDEEELDVWTKEHQHQIADLEQKLQGVANDAAEDLKTQIVALKAQRPPFEQALSVQARLGARPATHVLARGDYQTPLQQVKSDCPELFHSLGWVDTSRAETAIDQPGNSLSHRLDFARWLTGPARPLTARVLANRIWLNHFGSGIVETPDDFGYTGLPPSNVELLDYLADRLISNGWSVKSLHRTIMNSQAYRRSSSLLSPEAQSNAAIDPGNRRFWRQNLRRLDAEAIRDSMLTYAGVLHAKSGGPSVFSDLPNEIRDTANPISLSFWGTSPLEEQNCRSVYLFVKRSLKNPFLEAFDFANGHSPVGQRPITTVAPQALVLLNDGFVRLHAEHLAKRTATHSTDPEQRIEALWRIVWQRRPTVTESELARSFLSIEFANQTDSDRWIALARAVLNSNETLFVD